MSIFRISLPTQRNAHKETCQGDNGLEFCLRKILHTFSPLETLFGLRKLRHVVLPRPPGEVPRRGGEGVGTGGHVNPQKLVFARFGQPHALPLIQKLGKIYPRKYPRIYPKSEKTRQAKRFAEFCYVFL